MTETPSGSSGTPTDDAGEETLGYEGYPYASVEAERRIKLIASLMSLVTVGMLLAGLYLALGTERFGAGGILTLIGFIALMMVPFVAKRMRRAALAREAGQA
jgi:hypothetical protein